MGLAGLVLTAFLLASVTTQGAGGVLGVPVTTIGLAVVSGLVSIALIVKALMESI